MRWTIAFDFRRSGFVSWRLVSIIDQRYSISKSSCPPSPKISWNTTMCSDPGRRAVCRKRAGCGRHFSASSWRSSNGARRPQPSRTLAASLVDQEPAATPCRSLISRTMLTPFRACVETAILRWLEIKCREHSRPRSPRPTRGLMSRFENEAVLIAGVSTGTLPSTPGNDKMIWNIGSTHFVRHGFATSLSHQRGKRQGTEKLVGGPASLDSTASFRRPRKFGSTWKLQDLLRKLHRRVSSPSPPTSSNCRSAGRSSTPRRPAGQR